MEKLAPRDAHSFCIHHSKMSALEREKFRENLKQNYGIEISEEPIVGITIPERCH